MNEDNEWVVYQGKNSRYIHATSAESWDEFFRYSAEIGEEINLTLLARGLTQEQAQAMTKLIEE